MGRIKTRIQTFFLLCGMLISVGCTAESPASTPESEPSTMHQPTETAATLPPQNEAENLFSFGELEVTVGFNFPDGFGQSVSTSEMGVHEPQAPFELPYPRHARILFNSYSSGEEGILAAGLRIFRVDEVNALEAGVIESLNAVLEEQTDHHSDFPKLAGAGSVIDAQLVPLAFRNGMGYRYLLTKSFSADPLNSTTVTYLYQGITSDEKYFVSFIMDVNAPFLAEYLGQTLTTGEEFETYYQNVNTSVESAAGDQFSPSLIALDELVSSVIVLEK